MGSIVGRAAVDEHEPAHVTAAGQPRWWACPSQPTLDGRKVEASNEVVSDDCRPDAFMFCKDFHAAAPVPDKK
jgi:hypothetical protein